MSVNEGADFNTCTVNQQPETATESLLFCIGMYWRKNVTLRYPRVGCSVHPNVVIVTFASNLMVHQIFDIVMMFVKSVESVHICNLCGQCGTLL